ncbi:MAG: D-cysteine desulfhydrase family protein [Anaerolineae bacterium]
MLHQPPRYPLACLPTPLHRLPGLERRLGGPQLWIKRDDLTGLGGGGNKVRKLELLVADAQAQEAETLITTGAVQSNHARQTAAAAARAGLGAVLVLAPMAPPTITGNLLLDHLVGARIRWTGDRDRYELMQEIADEERAAGRNPYIIPYGGSNAIGAAAYALAMQELAQQQEAMGISFSHVVFATSSGGTQAGLVTGALATGWEGTVLGISVDKPADVLAPSVLELARLTATYLGIEQVPQMAHVHVNGDYRGAGYAIMGAPEREAIRLVAESEGLLVDPVYTGRAMAGLMDLVRKGDLGKKDRVLFWHTGGTPALFAYADELLAE